MALDRPWGQGRRSEAARLDLDFELLNRSPGGVESVVRPGPVGHRDRLTLIVLGLVLLGVFWLIGWGGVDGDGVDSDLRSVGPPPSASASDTTDTAPTDTESSNTESSNTEPTTTVTRSGSALTFPPPPARAGARVVSVDDGDLGSNPLGREVGLWVYVGGDNPLQRFDLDTGDHELYGIRAAPVLATDQELVVATWPAGQIGWVGHDDPAEEAEGWLKAEVAPIEGADEIWVRRQGQPDKWDRIDLLTRRIVSVLPVVEQANLATVADDVERVVRLGPELISAADGVYAPVDAVGGHQRVADGRLLAAGSGLALVERCGVSLEDCSTTWLDLNGQGDRGELATPRADLVEGWVVGGGRWLKTRTLSGAGELVSTETGDILIRARSPLAISVSNDGSLAAVLAQDGAIEIFDLTMVTDPSGAGPEPVLIIDRLYEPGAGSVLLADKP